VVKENGTSNSINMHSKALGLKIVNPSRAKEIYWAIFGFAGSICKITKTNLQILTAQCKLFLL
jgi:hypothetical protein